MSPPSHYDPSAPSEEPLQAVVVGLQKVIPEVVFFPPRTRRGHGPGIIVLLSLPPDSVKKRERPTLDPPPYIKFAEEGFAVLVAIINDGPEWPVSVERALEVGMEKLMKEEVVDEKNRVSVLVWGSKENFDKTILLLSQYPKITSMVAYDIVVASSPVPTLVHLSATAEKSSTTEHIKTYVYSGTDKYFYESDRETFKPGPAGVAHTRTTDFLRKQLGGPYFDLESIWDEHCRYEFEERSVAKTMGTMVEEPYVNHVPTMTGGIGREKLTAFYRDHFIFKNPRDSSLELVSRTVGSDRVIDEFIFHLTHDTAVDWLLPSVPPTGKKLAIPMVAVVHIRGDRLAHEHIWWDQAGALLQAGLLPERVSLPGGSSDKSVRLPIAGIEAARLVVDETDGTSNAMLGENGSEISKEKNAMTRIWVRKNGRLNA